MSESPLFCHRCSVELEAGRGQFYVVRIEAFADPSPPVISSEDLKRDHSCDIQRLIENVGDLSSQEAMDQVYRRLTICLCNTCYVSWIEDPAQR